MNYKSDTPRKFGIELEISRRLVNLGTDQRLKSSNWRALKLILNELIASGDISRSWKLKTDTSCGGEFVSPPMMPTASSFRQIARICKEVKSFAKKKGYPSVDAECGMHIHFDASDLSAREMSRMFMVMAMAEPILFAMYRHRVKEYVHPLDLNMLQASRCRDMVDVRDVWYRNTNNKKDPAYQYDENFVCSTRSGERYDGTRYHGFNIHSFWSIGTVEFRYASGTLDMHDIVGYYYLCLALVNRAVYGKKIRYSKATMAMYRNLMPNRYNEMLKRGTFRQYIIDFANEMGLKNSTVKFIIDRIKKENGSDTGLLRRMNPKVWVHKGNIDDVCFLVTHPITGGQLYCDWQGKQVGARRICIGGTVDADFNFTPTDRNTEVVGIELNFRKGMSAQKKKRLDSLFYKTTTNVIFTDTGTSSF